MLMTLAQRKGSTVWLLLWLVGCARAWSPRVGSWCRLAECWDWERTQCHPAVSSRTRPRIQDNSWQKVAVKGRGNRRVQHLLSYSTYVFAFLLSWTSCYGAPSHQASCSGDQWLSPRSRAAGNQPCPANLPRFTLPWHTFSPSHPLSEPSLRPRTTSVPSIWHLGLPQALATGTNTTSAGESQGLGHEFGRLKWRKARPLSLPS